MSLLLQIILACLAGGILSLFAAALLMFALPQKCLPYAVSFSTGLLLATSMLHLLPEALAAGVTPVQAFPVLLAGLLVFFALEKFSLWQQARRHAAAKSKQLATKGGEDAQENTQGMAATGAFSVLIGDGFHNFTDGLLIAAAFLTDPALGWATSFAIIAHEIPQEAGDFAILLAAGWQRKRALYWNGLSGLTSVAGGLAGYAALAHTQVWIPYIVILAAASFLYIAMVNLLPRLRLDLQGMGWHGLSLAGGVMLSVL